MVTWCGRCYFLSLVCRSLGLDGSWLRCRSFCSISFRGARRSGRFIFITPLQSCPCSGWHSLKLPPVIGFGSLFQPWFGARCFFFYFQPVSLRKFVGDRLRELRLPWRIGLPEERIAC